MAQKKPGGYAFTPTPRRRTRRERGRENRCSRTRGENHAGTDVGGYGRNTVGTRRCARYGTRYGPGHPSIGFASPVLDSKMSPDIEPLEVQRRDPTERIDGNVQQRGVGGRGRHLVAMGTAMGGRREIAKPADTAHQRARRR